MSVSAISPLLREAFGCSTGLVDVLVARDPHYFAVSPCVNLRDSLSNVTRAAHRTAVHRKDAERDSVAEVDNLLRVNLELIVRVRVAVLISCWLLNRHHG